MHDARAELEGRDGLGEAGDNVVGYTELRVLVAEAGDEWSSEEDG